ncbi:alpha/beta fold hydrolase [Egicoccus sp. AB-alg2]|uniref:alpha/beta fold hydrolase n=1 Tax=Egicoccus sp. AB-alg2 TaxID=3242693 RepID=UPI00359E5E25
MAARFTRANGLTFAYVEAGPPDGPLALCLHGFPDTPATWRHLLPRLAEAGFHAVAPWARGYPPTGVPDRVRVEPDTLAADVNALHRALGGGRDAVLIGHDWGAIAGMRAAAAAPERWRRLVTLAVPPERVLLGAAGDGPQVVRSRYALAALLPGAEHRMASADAAGFVRLWRRWSPDYVPTEDDLAPLRAVLRSPGAPRAVLAYYRGFVPAVLSGRALSHRVPLPPQPHLMLHGRDDGCIGVVWAERSIGRLPHPASRVVILDGVGHFLHLERPDDVGDLVLDHVVAPGTPPSTATAQPSTP